MKYIHLIFAVMLLTANTSCAASYDCEKASTKVEKMICTDSELSKLDEELGKTYSAALKKTPDLLALKQQQRDWLKERNGCADSGCLKAHYQQRNGELARIVSLVPIAKGQESHYFEKEADKLLVIRDVVRHQKLSYYNRYEEEPEFCTQILKDFVAGKDTKAVEPDVRTDDVNHPALARLTGLCTDAEPKPLDEPEPEFLSVGLLGGPPYRYYHINVDGNLENGKEDVVYHEATVINDSVIGSTGYAWVDLKACLVAGGSGVQSRMLGFGQPQNLYRLNALALYKGILFSLELDPSFWGAYPTRYRFVASRIERVQKPYLCAWHSAVPEEERSNIQEPKSDRGK